MSQNPEHEGFADALHGAAAVFEPPDAARLHDAAVRRGRQLRRRRAGVAVVSGTVALGTAGVLAAFALPGAAGHSTAAVITAPPAAGHSSPSYPRPTALPPIRAGEISGPLFQTVLEYVLPSGAQVVVTGGPNDPNEDVEVLDTSTHSYYVQTAVTIKSSGRFGTLISVSVAHTAGSDTCAFLEQARKGSTCTRSTLAGGKLLDNVVSSDGVLEFFEWTSPAGYEIDLELQDSTVHDFALTKAQAEAIITNQVFGTVARTLPPDPCVGGTFSKPVDPPSPGMSPLQHVRCSTDGKLYPSY
jgi:hypothetical protein